MGDKHTQKIEPTPKSAESLPKHHQQNNRMTEATKDTRESDRRSPPINVPSKSKVNCTVVNGALNEVNTLGAARIKGGVIDSSLQDADHGSVADVLKSPGTSHKRKREGKPHGDIRDVGNADVTGEICKRPRMDDSRIGEDVDKTTISQDLEEGEVEEVYPRTDGDKPSPSHDLATGLQVLSRTELPPGYSIIPRPPTILDYVGGSYNPTHRTPLYVDEMMCKPPQKLKSSDFPEGGVFMALTSRPTCDENAQLGRNFYPGAGGLMCEKPHYYWIIHNDDHCMITIGCTTHGGKGGINKFGNVLRGHVKFEDVMEEAHQAHQSNRGLVSGDNRGHAPKEARVVRLVARVKGAPKIADNAYFNFFQVDTRDFIRDTLPIGFTSKDDTYWARNQVVDHLRNHNIPSFQEERDAFLDRGATGWANVQAAKNKAVLEKARGITRSGGNDWDTGLTKALVIAEFGPSTAIPAFDYAVSAPSYNEQS